MKNLWIIMSPALIAILAGIVVVIVLLVKKKKKYTLTAICLTVCIVILTPIGLMDFFKDISSNATESFEGVFQEVQTGGTYAGTNRNLFDVDGKQEKVYIPQIIWGNYNLVEGKTYQVEYFVNTRILRSIEPLD